jgi:hypothetical protein
VAQAIATAQNASIDATYLRTVSWRRLSGDQWQVQVLDGEGIVMASGVGNKEDAYLAISDELIPAD